MSRKSLPLAAALAAAILLSPAGASTSAAVQRVEDVPEPPVAGMGADAPEVPDPTEPIQSGVDKTPGQIEQPDLTIASIDVPRATVSGAGLGPLATDPGPPCFVVGQSIGNRVEIEVENQGDVGVSQTFSIGFFLSPEPVITGFNTLLKGGRVAMDGISPRSTKTFDVPPSPSIPSDYEPGDAYLGAIVDHGDSVGESDENNNSYTTPVRIVSKAEGCL